MGKYIQDRVKIYGYLLEVDVWNKGWDLRFELIFQDSEEVSGRLKNLERKENDKYGLGTCIVGKVGVKV